MTKTAIKLAMYRRALEDKDVAEQRAIVDYNDSLKILDHGADADAAQDAVAEILRHVTVQEVIDYEALR